jgi:L-2-hydroxyglutarate oxidase LhgO
MMARPSHPKPTMHVQTIVIGAGIVGLAVARALADSGREVLVLERAEHVGAETSSRNSEVVHSGLYYAPGSLKARTCVRGAAQLYEYCVARGVPHRRTGKLIVATTDAERAALERYLQLGTANGVQGLRLIGPDEANALEPEVRCVAALHSPATGIVDSHALMVALWGDLQHAGGDVVFRTAVLGGSRESETFALRLDGDADELRCSELVNAAGLYAPTLARTLTDCAGDAAPTAYYARGHYYTLSGKPPFQRLVYPIAEAAGLGIHATIDLAGRVRFGPDVEWTNEIDYRFDETRRAAFAASIRRYYPGLDDARLQPDYVGVRPKIVGPGGATADFRIDGPAVHGIPGLVHMYGIESPGLTACLALAEVVRDALDGTRAQAARIAHSPVDVR